MKYLSVMGKDDQIEYLLSQSIFWLIGFLILAGLVVQTFDGSGSLILPFFGVIYLISASVIRRMRDANIHWVFLILAFTPVLPFAMLILLAIPSNTKWRLPW